MMKTVDSRFLEVELFSGHSYEDVVSDADRRKSLEARTFPFMENRFERQVFRMALPGYDLERSDLDIFKTGFKMLNLEDLSYMIDSISDIIVSQEERLRMLVLPTYRSPDLHYAIFDSVRRSKIPENFQRHFSQQSKNMRQMSVQEALNNARNQTDQMVGFIYELENHNRRTWRYKIAWHQKLAMPFACLVFFFIGAPLGAIIRKGGVGMPIIIAIIFYVFYYVISMIGEKSAREGAMTPFEGMWMSAAIILAIGIFLTWMATRDSQIFNIELYTNYAKKIIRDTSKNVYPMLPGANTFWKTPAIAPSKKLAIA
jgi:lipopolysaccharide export system permease protein